MRKVCLVLMLLLPVGVSAQSYVTQKPVAPTTQPKTTVVRALASGVIVLTPNTRIAWDHDGQFVDTWKLSVDSKESDVTATTTHDPSGFWSVPFPDMLPGAHVIVISACNAMGCGASDPFAVTVAGVPTKPLSVRVISIGQ